MKVIILAGGKGTRMGSLTESIPKPMVLLAGKPVLEHQINFLKSYNLTDVFMLLGHKGEIIKKYFKDGKKFGVNIKYFFDPKPLGTAGSLKEIEKFILEPFLLFYGDTMIDINLTQFIDFHDEKQSIASLVVHPNDHPKDSDLLDIDNEDYVTNFFPKPHKNIFNLRNLVNAALYILNPEIFDFIDKGVFSDFGKDIFPKVLHKRKLISAYNTTEYIKDIGTPSRLLEVEKDFLSGKVQLRNKINKQKAIFLDRDGVINQELERINKIDKFNLLPNVIESVKNINQSDFLNVVVTNQPIVAKGFISEKKLREIHNYMETKFGLKGAYFNRIYYCPHHPERGHEGEKKEFKILCECRKPGTEMIERAVKDMNIDPRESFIIGDRTVDIMTGINSKLKTILLRQGYAGKDRKYDCQPDFVFNDLYEATSFILNDFFKILSKIKKYFNKVTFNENKTIISVSGLSRSGKTTFSSILKQYFLDFKINTTLIQLDDWIVPLKKRSKKMDVRSRYQYDVIKKDLKLLFEGKKVILNKYNPKNRGKKETSKLYSLENSNIVILEGVVALDIDYIRDITDHSFYIKTDESIRRRRFESFYIDKKLTIKDIESLYAKREFDESPIVINSEKYANQIIEMDNL